MSSLRRAALAASIATLALTAAHLLGCTAPPPARAPLAGVPRERAAMPPVSARPASAAAPTLPSVVRVRIEGVEQSSVLEVTLSDGATVTLRREGNDVVDGRGARSRTLTLRAAQNGALTLRGRAYPGALVVTPHPKIGLRVHNEVAFEAYVTGVVAAELVLWSAAPAELEAQAIAARTYAAGRVHRARAEGAEPELLDSVLDQAYKGLFKVQNPKERAIAERLDAAVRATHGIALLRGDGFEEARFHASCGGATATFADVFAEPGPGPSSVTCEPCRTRADAEAAAGAPDTKRPLGWRVTVTQTALAQAGAALGLGGPILALGPKRLDPSGRWLEVQLRGSKGVVSVPFDALRRALGYGELKSARIVGATPQFGQTLRAGVTLAGLGRGHGVGLCQEGCRDLARAGWSAERILAHYYPGARLERFGAPPIPLEASAH